MRSHEINRFRRHFFGGHYQVTFVLTIGIIRYYDNAALGDVAYHIVNSVELKRLLRLGDHRTNTITFPAVLSNSYSSFIFISVIETEQVGAVHPNRLGRLRSIAPTCRDNRLRPVHVTITRLKFGFKFHFELREIDRIPACEFSCVVFLPWLMFESNNQMHGLIAHLAVVVGAADPARSAETRNAVITESADMRAFAD